MHSNMYEIGKYSNAYATIITTTNHHSRRCNMVLSDNLIKGGFFYFEKREKGQLSSAANTRRWKEGAPYI